MTHRTCHDGINLAEATRRTMQKLDCGTYAASGVVRALPTATWNPEQLSAREWLVTNGLGGYASGTLAGPPTRRYHALLVAALPAPLGRLVLMSQLEERVRLPEGRIAFLSSRDRSRVSVMDFRLVGGLPVWRYAVDNVVLEKRVFMPHEQNTTLVTYTLVDALEPVRFGLRPLAGARMHEAPVDRIVPVAPLVSAYPTWLEVALGEGVPTLRLAVRDHKATFALDDYVTRDIHYSIEGERGYPAHGDAWGPGYYKLDLVRGERVTFVATTEPIGVVDALSPERAWEAELERRTRLLVAAGCPEPDTLTAELVLAADQFVVRPATRVADEARARAAGENARSIIAGYHWFTDWGRDTMISLEGLVLSTGRTAEARDTLLTFAQHLRNGLIPNLFPEGDQEGLYNTADATLWFFHALDRYVSIAHDHDTLHDLLPALDEVVRAHREGTLFGIHVERDGLLAQGQEGVALTWMDAKVEDWVVTPRRGKTVETNALWYNALRLLAAWHRQFGEDDRDLSELARLAQHSFNARFWFDSGGYLYDIVDGDSGNDSACRPNQVLSFALRYPVLEQSRWASVLSIVTGRLLTPFGLRTLDSGHPAFKTQYFGDLRARDAAYHQGTVWPWLIGPFIDAWLKVHPDGRAQALRFLSAFDGHLSDACIGSISEIFDATAPYAPRGCIAQAWSVAEVLRCLIALQPASERPS